MELLVFLYLLVKTCASMTILGNHRSCRKFSLKINFVPKEILEPFLCLACGREVLPQC